MAQQQRNRQVQPASGPRKAFGQALREIREAKGLSQQRLATEAEIDRSYVSLVERGIQGPTIQAIVKIAQALGIRSSEIVQRMEAILAEAQKPRTTGED